RDRRATIRPEPDQFGSTARGQDMNSQHVSTLRVDHAVGGHAVDAAHMEHAIAAALQGTETDPNPRVGCVIVPADGSAPVTGWHRGAGTFLEEIVALQRPVEPPHGATVYVSLEPCAHTGRTGPCADALIAAGIARVVYAVAHPSGSASGGAQRLAGRGISVQG